MKRDFFAFAWDNKGGKGPWGNAGGSKGGSNRSQRNGGGRGPEQPDMDELLRQAQERMRHMMGSGGTGGGDFNLDGKLFKLLLVGAVVVWLASGIYRVEPDEQGVVLRFGKYIQTTNPGLNYHLPWPFETVYTPKVTRENLSEIGFISGAAAANNFNFSGFNRNFSPDSVNDIPVESLMLTGDENIVDLDFTVRWRINEAKDYLFNVSDPVATVKAVGESAMREVVGQRPIDDALTENKTIIQQQVKDLMQQVMDTYRSGILITGVELQQVNPPKEVIDAFRDVQAARADNEKMQNEAIGYANDILPRARGQVAQIMQDAEAYKASKVAEATGAAQRFESQLAEYVKAREVTQKRLYLETMEEVLKNSRKVLVGEKAAQGVLPYLPLTQQQGGR